MCLKEDYSIGYHGYKSYLETYASIQKREAESRRNGMMTLSEQVFDGTYYGDVCMYVNSRNLSYRMKSIAT